MRYYAYIEDLKGNRYPIKQDGTIIESRKINYMDMCSYDTAWGACFLFRARHNCTFVYLGSCSLSGQDYIRKFGSLDAPYGWIKDWMGFTWD